MSPAAVPACPVEVYTIAPPPLRITLALATWQEIASPPARDVGRGELCELVQPGEPRGWRDWFRELRQMFARQPMAR